ncbi:efflux RND transporter periplasmic adaptor subunit [Brevibacillus migulae]|uniref:efflux RND transporter periplasmic adaptor subunit n=1 Tax=Brevibacillus migulae TaxID=1644114 RepID=UPI001431BADB|nr:efflux RND transporter periplasmic adaptor subunit [Brevibacillus migulae]
MKKKTSMIVGSLLLATAALSAVGCSNVSSADVTATMPAVRIMTLAQAAEAGTMASGKVVPDQEIQIVSKISGKVAQVLVKEGAQVKKGERLVQLEANDYQQQVQQAAASLDASQAQLSDLKAGARTQQITVQESALEQAKATYETAQRTYERTQALFTSGAVSQSDLDKISLELEKAKSAYEQANAQLDLTKAGATAYSVEAKAADVDRSRAALSLAQNTLANTSIVSPIDGVVASRSIDPGEMAQAGTPLLTVVNMEQVKVEASVGQDVVNQLKAGANVEVRVDGIQEQSFKGTVDFISPISDPNNNTFPVKITVQNPDHLLKAGMIAQVYFNGERQVQGFEVPASALMK